MKRSSINGEGRPTLIKGLQDIINLRASINLGLSEDLKTAFLNTIPVARPILESKDRSIPHGEWVAGFTTGEGTKKGRNKVGVGFLLVFQIAQHLRDEVLLRSLVDYFSCGHFVQPKLKEWGYYRCTKFVDNYRIVEFFNKYPIRGAKANDFSDWARAADIIKKGGSSYKWRSSRN